LHVEKLKPAFRSAARRGRSWAQHIARRRKAALHVSVRNSRLGGAKLANIGDLRCVRSRLPDRDAAKRDVETLISRTDGRMIRILTTGMMR